MPQKQPPQTASAALKEALALLNGGKNWHKGGLRVRVLYLLFFHQTKYCMLGAVKHVDGPAEHKAYTYLSKAIEDYNGGCSIPWFNDSSDTTFANVKAVFLKAIALAEADEFDPSACA